MKNSLPKVGTIILAAGASTRMGTPKQLLQFKGRSLLRHTTEVALASVCEPMIVVLGAYAEQIHNEVNQLPVVVVENQEWHLGMGASIRVGINAPNDSSENIEAVVLLLCDQPFVCVDVVNQLVEAYHTTLQPIVASEYAGILGVPALFSRKFFSELISLNVAAGAKEVIKKYSHLVFPVSFAAGVIDIDTPQDYEQLQYSR